MKNLLTTFSQKIQYTGLTNPAINSNDGTQAGLTATGGPLAGIIARLWRAIVVAGALMVILFLVWGCIEWIMSAGDEGKLKNARNRIFNAIIGMVILVASYAIVKFIELIFDFDIVNVAWPTVAN